MSDTWLQIGKAAEGLLRHSIAGAFDGETFDKDRDGARLNRQSQAVYALMKDGQWRTLQGISALLDEPEASVSARLRDLRKEKFGGYIVERRYVGDGLWQYRVLPPQTREEYQLELGIAS